MKVKLSRDNILTIEKDGNSIKARMNNSEHVVNIVRMPLSVIVKRVSSNNLRWEGI